MRILVPGPARRAAPHEFLYALDCAIVRRRIRVSRGRIRRDVRLALKSMPSQFAAAVENVTIVVEERPRKADLTAGRHERNAPLMGIYRGIPLPERHEYNLVAPDMIAIFRRPLLQLCRTRRQVFHEVRLTVLHELGHYLGLPEEAVEHL